MEHDWVKVWSGVEKNDSLALLRFRIHSDSEYTQIQKHSDSEYTEKLTYESILIG